VRALLAAVLLAAVGPGATGLAAAAPPPADPACDEPGVAELQAAAARLAEVQPERVRALLRRSRAAAILPTVRMRAGQSPYSSILEPTEGWRFEVQATWSLDRLLFHRDELALVRETQRLAARREALVTEVAQLYFARRRLLLEPDGELDPREALERRLAVEELTAILDGLTGGALSRRARARPPQPVGDP
jgi:hypothetical protein